MNQQAVRQEQRSMRRFAMQLPVEVKNGVSEVIAATRDVSAKGIFLFLDHEIPSDTRLEFTLTLPPEVTMTQAIRVKCTGRVVRVERDARGKFGIAAMIDHYQFLDSSLT
jgi:PilZ domain